MKLEILNDRAAVAQRAAEILCGLCPKGSAGGDGARESDYYTVALSGGTTPKALYKLLASDPWSHHVPWGKIRWFMGDERTVPLDHQDSNFGLARETMLTPMGVDADLQFPLPHIGVAPPMQVASDYETEIVQWVKPGADGTTPAFDVILLGVGSDGHTASLFPHTSALNPPMNKFVVANFVEKLKTWRITVTPEIIRHARNVIVMVTGEDKAEALKHVLEGPADFELYPAQIGRDLPGATWLIDTGAAAALEK